MKQRNSFGVVETNTIICWNCCDRAEPHYGWADAIGNSVQLLSIEPLERPPGTFPSVEPTPRDQQQMREPVMKEEEPGSIAEQEQEPEPGVDEDQPRQD